MLRISDCCGGNIYYNDGYCFCQICHKACEYEEQEDQDTKPYYHRVKSKDLKLRAWDPQTETMVYSTEEGAVFTCFEGKWSVKYVREKTFNNGGIEIDAPVEIESDEVQVMIF